MGLGCWRLSCQQWPEASSSPCGRSRCGFSSALPQGLPASCHIPFLSPATYPVVPFAPLPHPRLPVLPRRTDPLRARLPGRLGIARFKTIPASNEPSFCLCPLKCLMNVFRARAKQGVSPCGCLPVRAVRRLRPAPWAEAAGGSFPALQQRPWAGAPRLAAEWRAFGLWEELGSSSVLVGCPTATQSVGAPIAALSPQVPLSPLLPWRG